MSTHPNTILLLTLTPAGLARKTMRDIRAEQGLEDDDNDSDIKIDGVGYHTKVMESDYDDGYQLTSKEGDLLFLDFVTYGYGEQIEWSKLASQKESLEAWAKGICERHNCSYRISVTANRW